MLDKNHDVTVTRGALEIGTIPDAVRRAARRDGVLHVSVNGRLQSIPVDWVLKAKKRYAEAAPQGGGAEPVNDRAARVASRTAPRIESKPGAFAATSYGQSGTGKNANALCQLSVGRTFMEAVNVLAITNSFFLSPNGEPDASSRTVYALSCPSFTPYSFASLHGFVMSLIARLMPGTFARSLSEQSGHWSFLVVLSVVILAI